MTGNSLTVTVVPGSRLSHGTARLSVAHGKVHISGTFVEGDGTKGTFGAVFPLSHGSSNIVVVEHRNEQDNDLDDDIALGQAPDLHSGRLHDRGQRALDLDVHRAGGRRQRAAVESADRHGGFLGHERHGREHLRAGRDARFARIASCTVSYAVGESIQGEPPPVSAHYGGDSTFAPSSGSSSYKPASVLVPSSDTVDLSSSIDGIETDLGNPDPFPMTADEELAALREHQYDADQGRRPESVAPKPKVIGRVSVRFEAAFEAHDDGQVTSAGRKLLARHKLLHAVLMVTTTAKGKPTKTVTRHWWSRRSSDPSRLIEHTRDTVLAGACVGRGQTA